MTPRIPFAAAAALAFAFTLTSCSAAPEAAAPTPKPTPDASTPAAQPIAEETPAPEETPTTPTCETIIAPSTVATLTELGWTFQEQEFRLGADAVEGGIQCVWGDYTVASDHVQIYGWAPIEQDASVAGQQKLIAEGWQRADADGRVYVTENPATAIAVDEDGFGMTYEFGDGWVSLADTKQSLVLVDFP